MIYQNYIYKVIQVLGKTNKNFTFNLQTINSIEKVFKAKLQ